MLMRADTYRFRKSAAGLATLLLAILLGLGHGVPGIAQVFDERFTDWPSDLKINGQVIVARYLDDVSVLGELFDFEKAGKTLLIGESQMVSEESISNLVSKDADAAELQTLDGLASLDAELRFDLIVLLCESEMDWSEDKKTHAYFRDHLASGGTLIALGPHAFDAVGVQGFNLMPECLLVKTPAGSPDWQKLIDGADETKILSDLACGDPRVGICLDDNTALSLQGRKMWLAGLGKATFLLAGNEGTSMRVESISARGSDRQRPSEWLIDLTEWRRDARDRLLEPFPAENPRAPMVQNGKLFIVGGGGLPPGLMEDFVEAAGGAKAANLVYVPCSEADEVSERQSIVELWKRMGVSNATFIHTKDREQANTDEAFLLPLRDATGIWFGGGRQWNFSDSYYGTEAHRLMKAVLERGGVIGGSSAGASIQARYLARATPIENFRIMAPGYERGGLGFISGVAIDQHFTQRGRQKDMTQLVERYPQLLGIGIDETTAIVVEKSIARVVGAGDVYFYNRKHATEAGADDFERLGAGQSYDLLNRKPVAKPSGD